MKDYHLYLGELISFGHNASKEAKDAICDLCDLQAPMRPVGIDTCPRCGTWLSKDCHYCPHCGQHIDWEEKKCSKLTRKKSA